MSENKTINTLLNTELPPSIDNAIKNLSDKPTASIGTTVSDIWYIVFGWISSVADKRRIKYAYSLEQFRQELENSVSKIPPEKQIEPSFQATAQALENAKYCVEEDELRQMFCALISNSMNSDFASNVHPSFAEIIKQMSVLDAKIIRLFKTKKEIIIGLPVCQFRLNFFGPSSYTPIPDHIFLELPDVDFQLCSQSLSSLSRFGVVSISYEKKLSTPNVYDKFLSHPLYQSMRKYLPAPIDIHIKEGTVELTPLGHSFVKVCIPN